MIGTVAIEINIHQTAQNQTTIANMEPGGQRLISQ